MEQLKSKTISIVIPAYNEEEVIEEFWRRTTTVLKSTNLNYELVFVNDGSKDNTLAIMLDLQKKDDHISVVNLSRNFGKEIALTAGLEASCGDALIIIDADLQDPPELILELVSKWQEGYDIVYAVRSSRDGETWFKKVTATLFYRIIQSMTRIEIPRDTGDFRLMNRRAVDALLQLREQHRFMKGLFAWVGYHSTPIYYQRDPRAAGSTKWNYWKLWNFALEGITSFTVAPLKIATYLGLLVAFIAFLYALVVIYKTVMYGEPVQGYPSLMVVLLFLGGTQLVFTGILGEYLGRIFNETKRRPLYILESIRPSRLKRNSVIATPDNHDSAKFTPQS